MEVLDKKYKKELEEIIKAIQNSDQLKSYLEEEEDEFYDELKDQYEPKISDLYHRISDVDPLQIVSFEKELLNEELEGLYLPRILGFAVLRGYVDENYKYTVPQNHFQDILLAICNSSNFDQIKQRIGQTIEIGFALSSDIWVTSLLNKVTNKRVNNYLQTHKLMKYRNPISRKIGYNRYLRQFKTENYLSADFPRHKNEIKLLYPGLKRFVVHRIMSDHNNTNLHKPLRAFIENEELFGTPEHLELTVLYTGFLDLSKEAKAKIFSILSELRKSPQFEQQLLEMVLGIYHSKIKADKRFDQNISELIDRSVKDDISAYYDLTDVIHTKGYIHQDAVAAVEKFYNNHEGLSLINKCVRKVISNYYDKLLKNLEPQEYNEMMELTKTFPLYMNVFGNEAFNHHLRGLSLGFVKRFLRAYKDKRSKDYQDLKKFVNSHFIDLKFLTSKESVELFKTKRKKKVVA
ncbi:MAG: hypothetical protein KJP00_04125 [Bacteroidia bacterium]|nr:hypothetical protein [Bacteroidia bacterium]